MDAVRLINATKTYRIGVGRARIREMLPYPFDRAAQRVFPRWWLKDTFNALEDVSISVEQGGSVGLVGHNGAGKTTLLKLIGSITSPTHGRIETRGRIAALIDVLVGFHPDLTGRENIYLLAAIQGFSRKMVSSRVDRIFEFAEITDLADTPVKRYSAGMSARLGFATVTSLDPDVLLIDEVLAVGDASFQRKCVAWLDGYRANGGTLLFVSHNLGLVRNMTRRTVWLDHGKVRDDGPTGEVLARYAVAMEQRDQGRPAHRVRDAHKAMATRGLYRWGAGGARVEQVHVETSEQNGRHLEIAITYLAEGIDEAVFSVGFLDETGNEVAECSSPTVPVNGSVGSIRCAIKPLPFRSGIYFPIVAVFSTDGMVRDRWRLDRGIVIDPDGGPGFEATGVVNIPGNWSMD